MNVFCGIDWAEEHHDIAIIDNQGLLLAKKRIPETLDGFSQLSELFDAICRENGIEHPPSLLQPAGCAAGVG